MKRGDIATAALPGADAKTRPVRVVQSDDLAELDSVVVCPITSHVRGFELRVILKPDLSNGLEKLSRVMCDKFSILPIINVRDPIGTLDAATLREVEQQLMVVIGLA